MIFGKLDRKITIQQPTYTADSETGERKVSSWSTYKSAWAQRVHNQSLEQISGDQIILVDTYNFKIRYNDAPNITGVMRVLYDSEYYDIMGLKELGRREGWLLTLTKRDN